MLTYCLMYKHNQSLPVDTNINTTNVYRLPHVQIQSMFAHRLKYNHEQCLHMD